MTTSRSPRLDCLPLTPSGPHNAPPAPGETAVGGRKKAARRASFQLFPPTHRTLSLPRPCEGRTAA
jgi:hypothetical protein